jgi:hypothetical protein
VNYSIEPRAGFLYAEVSQRETAAEMREFLTAVQSACRQYALPKILLVVRRSRAVFKPEDYGLSGYANELATPECQIAVIGDTDEVNAAHEYIELVARQQGLNVRAFRDERIALRWLGGEVSQVRRYRFTRLVIAGAPLEGGVYSLWDGEEPVYHGRAASIRPRLVEHYDSGLRATYYSWEVCDDPVAREAELLREHEARYGRLPRHNETRAA